MTNNNYGEMHLSPVWKGRDFTTGRYLKGHIPANKGKTWNETMGKRAQKRAAKGWKNLELHRCKGGGPNSGKPKKQVVVLSDEGKFAVFPSVKATAVYYGIKWENIARCCRQNQCGTICRNGEVNTDHKYKGFRFYFEGDSVWLKKLQL